MGRNTRTAAARYRTFMTTGSYADATNTCLKRTRPLLGNYSMIEFLLLR